MMTAEMEQAFVPSASSNATATTPAETTQPPIQNWILEPASDEILKIFNITSLEHQDISSYAEEIKKLHRMPVHGDVSNYHEAHIHLPRHLQELRATTTITKLTELNSTLKHSDWSKITAEMIDTQLVLTTFNNTEKRLLMDIKKLQDGSGKKLTVWSPTKPQNQYYLNIFLPRDWKIHTALLRLALKAL